MRKTAAMVSVVGVFLIGILVGALGMQVYHNNRPPGPGGDPGMERRLRFADRLGSLLELTDDQRQEIGTIRQESRVRAEAMRREMAPVVREQMEETRRRIMEVLTPEQQERLDQLGRRERRMVERFLLGERGRPDHPDRERPGRRGQRRP